MSDLTPDGIPKLKNGKRLDQVWGTDSHNHDLSDATKKAMREAEENDPIRKRQEEMEERVALRKALGRYC
jgi:hypothetical protein